MAKAISIRLEDDLIAFVDSITVIQNRSDKIRGVLLWLKQYQTHYLASVQEHIGMSVTPSSERLSEKS